MELGSEKAWRQARVWTFPPGRGRSSWGAQAQGAFDRQETHTESVSQSVLQKPRGDLRTRVLSDHIHQHASAVRLHRLGRRCSPLVAADAYPDCRYPACKLEPGLSSWRGKLSRSRASSSRFLLFSPVRTDQDSLRFCCFHPVAVRSRQVAEAAAPHKADRLSQT